MKKNIIAGFVFPVAGLLALAAELLIVNGRLQQLNILTYLLTIGIIPAAILFVSMLLHTAPGKAKPAHAYLLAVGMALVFSAVMLVYCGNAITPELVETILANSVTSETTQVSMTAASAGDNIQSVLIFMAFAGLGAFIGNRIGRKKRPSAPAALQDEYDG